MTLFARRHYRVIATEIKDCLQASDYPHETARLARNLAIIFEKDNARFQEDKFLEACGL